MEQFFTTLSWVNYIGTLRVFIVAAAYFATQMRYLNSDDLLFPAANLLGSALIGFSLFFNFNLASALMEVFWIAISLAGISKALKAP